MEYKFRGKRKDNGQWVVGSLISWPDGDKEILAPTSEAIGEKHSVLSESVGMWTGLKDVDGNMIFPGDIFGNIPQLRCVVHQRKDGEYRLEFIDKRITSISILDHKIGKSKIQGNITDNPELLTPSQKGDVLNSMNNITDPAAKQPDELKEQATEQLAAAESAAQDSAVGVEDETGAEAGEVIDAEEGGVQG